MKYSILLIWSLFIFINKTNAQTISLVDVVPSSTNNQSATVRAGQNGGSLIFNYNYAWGCEGSYQLNWSFSKDISSLKKCQKFDIYINCANCSSPCGCRKTWAKVGGANNITKIPGYIMYTYNGNVSLISTTADSFGVHSWYPGHRSHSYTMQVTPKKKASSTGFYVSIGYYIYGEGAVPSSNVNCRTLLGAGKLVSHLELGAYEGYGWDWMDKTIDYALNHIKASNCLSNSYLINLKSRIFRAQNTRTFYDEIRSYSQKFETEVATSCSACSSCSNEYSQPGQIIRKNSCNGIAHNTNYNVWLS